jgi:hypothetical protein
MTRDDLAEAMARAIWEAKTGGAPWSAVKPEIRHLWHADAEAMLPYLVEFVGEWIRDQDTDPKRLPYDGDILSRLEDWWREDMGA